MNNRIPGCLLLATMLISHAALADGNRGKSLQDAVSEARDRYPGRVLSADTERSGGRESHKIRILTDDGRVKRIRVDADSDRQRRR